MSNISQKDDDVELLNGVEKLEKSSKSLYKCAERSHTLLVTWTPEDKR